MNPKTIQNYGILFTQLVSEICLASAGSATRKRFARFDFSGAAAGCFLITEAFASGCFLITEASASGSGDEALAGGTKFSSVRRSFTVDSLLTLSYGVPTLWVHLEVGRSLGIH